MQKKVKSPDLGRMRKEIDEIDTAMLDLLNRRASIALEIAGIKRKTNLKFHSPERERAILERLTALNKGPFPNDTSFRLIRKVYPC